MRTSHKESHPESRIVPETEYVPEILGSLERERKWACGNTEHFFAYLQRYSITVEGACKHKCGKGDRGRFNAKRDDLAC